MLFKKKATKIVAIAAAVVLLLVAAVTGTVFAFKSTSANATSVEDITGNSDQYANVFIIHVPTGVTLYGSAPGDRDDTDYEAYTFDDAADGKVTIPKGSSIKAIGANSEENGKKFAVAMVSNTTNKAITFNYALSSSVKSISIAAGNNTSDAKINFTNTYISFKVTAWNSDGQWPELTITGTEVPKATFEYDNTKIRVTGTGFASSSKSMPLPEGGADLTFSAVGLNGYSISEIKYQVVGQEGQTFLPVSEDGVYSIHAEGFSVDGVLQSVKITITADTAKLHVNYNSASNVIYAEENPQTVNHGSALTFSFSFEKGYTLDAVTVKQDGRNVTGGSLQSNSPEDGKFTYTTGTITLEPVDITVTAKPAEYNVQVPSGDGYTISGAATKATHGTNYTFTVTAKNGYTVNSVEAKIGEGNNIAQQNGENGSYIILGENITGNINITVAATAATYQVKFAGNEKVKKYSATATYASDDSTFEVVLTPECGYQVSELEYSVGADGEQKTAASVSEKPNTFTIPKKEITGNVTLYPTAVGKAYNVEFTGSNFTKPKNLTATYGSTYTFTLTAKDGYEITGVSATVNGVNATVIGSGTYSLTVVGVGENETGEVEISVTTSPISRTVTFSGENYDHTGANTATIAEDYVFTVTAQTGYTLSSVEYTVVGSSSGPQLLEAGGEARNTYTIPKANIIGNITITVAVTAETYSVTVSATIDGKSFGSSNIADKFTVDEALSATHGQTLSFTVTALDGYAVTNVKATVAGVAQSVTDGGNGNYSIAGALVTGVISITIEGKEFGYTIKYNDPYDTSLPEQLTLKYSDEQWGEGTYNLPDSKEYYTRTWNQNRGGRLEPITDVKKDDIKTADAEISVSATWTLNIAKVADLLNFKTTLKSGSYNVFGAADLIVELSTDENSAKSNEWATFLSENATFNTHIVLGFVIFATGGSQGKMGYQTVQDAQQYWQGEGQNVLKSALADNRIFEKDHLGRLSDAGNGVDVGQYGSAFGIAYSNTADYCNYHYATDGEKLARRAIAYYIGVNCDGIGETLVASTVKSVEDALGIKSAMVSEVAIMPEAVTEQESDEEPTIE